MNSSTTKAPKWFYAVGIIALVWNLMGVMAYLGQVSGNTEGMTPEQIELIENAPSWVNAAFAIAVWGGTLGCILLLIKKAFAYHVFIISMIGIVVQMYYNLFISQASDVYGPGAIIMPFMVLLIALLLIYVAKKGRREGWLS